MFESNETNEPGKIRVDQLKHFFSFPNWVGRLRIATLPPLRDPYYMTQTADRYIFNAVTAWSKVYKDAISPGHTKCVMEKWYSLIISVQLHISRRDLLKQFVQYWGYTFTVLD